jgi:hypothetical protein
VLVQLIGRTRKQGLHPLPPQGQGDADRPVGDLIRATTSTSRVLHCMIQFSIRVVETRATTDLNATKEEPRVVSIRMVTIYGPWTMTLDHGELRNVVKFQSASLRYRGHDHNERDQSYVYGPFQSALSRYTGHDPIIPASWHSEVAVSIRAFAVHGP